MNWIWGGAGRGTEESGMTPQLQSEQLVRWSGDKGRTRFGKGEIRDLPLDVYHLRACEISKWQCRLAG